MSVDMATAPKLITYGNGDNILTVLLEQPNGKRYSYNLVLPNATPVPDELQLVGYCVMGPDFENGYMQLHVTCNGSDYLISLRTGSLDAMNRFQWFILPFFRPLYPYEVENLKKWGYIE